MYAISEGSAGYASRFPEFRDTAFYRSVLNLTVSSLDLGTYLGEAEDATDASYIDAIVAAGENGLNFFDTAAINYRNQRSERCMAPHCSGYSGTKS